MHNKMSDSHIFYSVICGFINVRDFKCYHTLDPGHHTEKINCLKFISLVMKLLKIVEHVSAIKALYTVR